MRFGATCSRLPALLERPLTHQSTLLERPLTHQSTCAYTAPVLLLFGRASYCPSPELVTHVGGLNILVILVGAAHLLRQPSSHSVYTRGILSAHLSLPPLPHSLSHARTQRMFARKAEYSRTQDEHRDATSIPRWAHGPLASLHQLHPKNSPPPPPPPPPLSLSLTHLQNEVLLLWCNFNFCDRRHKLAHLYRLHPSTPTSTPAHHAASHLHQCHLQQL